MHVGFADEVVVFVVVLVAVEVALEVVVVVLVVLATHVLQSLGMIQDFPFSLP